jgi:hypothetical protein
LDGQVRTQRWITQLTRLSKSSCADAHAAARIIGLGCKYVVSVEPRRRYTVQFILALNVTLAGSIRFGYMVRAHPVR